MADPAFDDQQGALRMMSEAPPAHYMVTIRSYSLFSKNSVDKYESGVFQAGGYRWKLVLFPNGNKSKNVKEHASLYLSMADTSSLPSGWKVHALVRFFLLDQDRDSYLVIQDARRKEWRFHRMKLEYGFDQFIPLETFSNARNGYLMDDACVIGVEVFVSTGKGENLSMVKDATAHTWKIDNFSKLNKEFTESKVFAAGNQNWKILLYPDGKGAGLGTFISLYLVLVDADGLPASARILANFTLRIVDQRHGDNISEKANHWFSPSSQESGWGKFMLLANFYNRMWGTLWNDSCVVEAEVTVLGIVDAL